MQWLVGCLFACSCGCLVGCVVGQEGPTSTQNTKHHQNQSFVNEISMGSQLVQNVAGISKWHHMQWLVGCLVACSHGELVCCTQSLSHWALATDMASCKPAGKTTSQPTNQPNTKAHEPLLSMSAHYTNHYIACEMLVVSLLGHLVVWLVTLLVGKAQRPLRTQNDNKTKVSSMKS
jgi:hypothetical protein